jgi:hypothetical protein
MTGRDLWLSIGVCICLLHVGCGGSERGGPVTGKVTVDGAPLIGARVSLVPQSSGADAGEAKGSFIATTDDAGVYELESAFDHSVEVPMGPSKLYISTAFSETVTPEGSTQGVTIPKERVTAPYPQGVDFEVPAGGTDAANFDLKSK